MLGHGPMRLAPRIFLLVTAFGSSLGIAAARAGALVEFPNVSEHAPTRLLGAVLIAVDRDLAGQYFDQHFRTAIAYYPGCGIPAASMTAPTLVLIGEADDWNPAERCREMVAHARQDGATIALTVYPGAYHAFCVP